MTDLKTAVARIEAGDTLAFANVPDGFDAFVAPISRARWPRRRRGAAGRLRPCGARRAALARLSRGAAPSPRPRSRCSTFPAGTASPTTASRPTPRIAARRMTALARLARSRSSAERPRILTHHGRLRCCSACRRCEAVGRRHLLRRAGQCREDGRSRALAGDQRLSALLHRARDRRIRHARRHPRSFRAGHAGAGAARLLRRHAGIDPRLRSRDAAHDRAVARARSRADERGAADDARRCAASGRPMSTRFGGQTRGDTLYEAVSEGRRHPGVEHWLPLVLRAHGHAVRLCRRRAAAARRAGRRRGGRTRSRRSQDYYDARKMRLRRRPRRARATSRWSPTRSISRPTNGASGIDARGRRALLALRRAGADRRGTRRSICGAQRRARLRARARRRKRQCVRGRRRACRRRCTAHGKTRHRRRLVGRLARAPRPCARPSTACASAEPVASLAGALALGKSAVALAVLGVEQGFETGDLAVIGEQDILGDRLVRRRRKSTSARENLLGEVARARRPAISSSMSITASAASSA